METITSISELDELPDLIIIHTIDDSVMKPQEQLKHAEGIRRYLYVSKCSCVYD